ncbi:MAG TPA: VOC family protein [Candidatus Binatus sp.]|uniref:VOC family protein n=1 Tax=Candidatus Binatus sp. TaxID=2811406 RepID=UPI002B477620|nr:VOC family protein [Candidatus Binatus sp.]HKN14602.1 VOC family protein [Candidatus Binatus sp.]
MALPARISIATLGVSDLARSTRFYLALGWELASESSTEISFFRTAGGVLALYPFDLLAKDAMLPPLRAQGFGGVTLAINVERAEDVQPGLDMAKAAGATILKPATKAEWGGVSGYFADPDGYPWEVVWAPRSRFKPDGSPDVS